MTFSFLHAKHDSGISIGSSLFASSAELSDSDSSSGVGSLVRFLDSFEISGIFKTRCRLCCVVPGNRRCLLLALASARGLVRGEAEQKLQCTK